MLADSSLFVVGSANYVRAGDASTLPQLVEERHVDDIASWSSSLPRSVEILRSYIDDEIMGEFLSAMGGVSNVLHHIEKRRRDRQQIPLKTQII